MVHNGSEESGSIAPPVGSSILAEFSYSSDDLRCEVLDAENILLNHFECSLEVVHFADSSTTDTSSDRISENSILGIFPPHIYESICVKAGDLLDFVRSAQGDWDGQCLLAKKESFFRLEKDNEAAFILSIEAPKTETALHPYFAATMDNDDGNIELALVFGGTPAALAIVHEGNYDSDFPPFYDDDAYVHVWHGGEFSKATIQRAVTAYLFELAASCGLDFHVERRPVNEMLPNSSIETLITQGERLRPLLQGEGIDQVITMFMDAVSSQPEHSIVGFTKVIEYVSATAARISSFSEIRHKLLSPRALRPDARFLSELKSLIENQRGEWKDDRKALKNTLCLCCDATELQPYAPNFCSLLKLKDGATPQEKAQALEDFADRISSTRNQLSHAKANYTPTGKECPEDSYAEFSFLCRVAAEQAIRWYATTDETLRHTNSPRAK